MLKFYKCSECDSIVTFVKNSGVDMTCNGSAMVEIIPGTTDAAVEKHVPEVKIEGNKVIVDVGAVTHPMTEAHLIEFIAIETKKGSQIKYLTAEDAPHAEFLLAEGDEFVAAYEYCNLHGL